LLAYDLPIAAPWDSASGTASGKRKHVAIVITREIDCASPKLLDALVKNETLQVVIETTDAPVVGPETVYRRITLTDATIAYVRPHIGRFAVAGKPLSDIAFVCGKVDDQVLTGRSAGPSALGVANLHGAGGSVTGKWVTGA
jgi:type VI secretion system Hcp family effector